MNVEAIICISVRAKYETHGNGGAELTNINGVLSSILTRLLIYVQ